MGSQTPQLSPGRAQASAEQPSLQTLIAENAPVSKWVPHFGNSREAIKHFASVHAGRNRLIGPRQPCFLCGNSSADSVATYRWSARFNKGVGFGGLDALLLIFGHLRVRVKNEVFSFNTLHPVCGSCARQLRTKRRLATLLKGVGVLLVLICSLFAGVMWGVFFTATHAKDRAEGLQDALIGTLLLAAGVACLVGARFLGVPAALRYLASRPFFCSSASFAARR
jgi:hypothetical protein